MTVPPTASTMQLPDAIGIYGLSMYTLVVAELSRRAGIRVEFVVDDAAGQQSLDGIRAGIESQGTPVWSRAEFAQWSLGRSQTPLISGRIQSESGQDPAQDPFRIASAEVAAFPRRSRFRWWHKSEPRTLWHPASLGEAFPVPASPGRFALFGAPGSGNMLAQTLIEDLLARQTQSMPDSVRWIGSIAEHFFLTTSNLIRARLAPAGIATYDCTPDEFPTMVVSLTTHDGGMAAIRMVPSNRHLALHHYHTHTTPSRSAVESFRRRNIPCLAIIRHPFETILACASKVRRPPGPILDDPAWLGTRAEGMIDWMQRLAESRGRITVIRYEDLTARNPESIRRLAGELGMTLTDAECTEMLDRHLFRDLVQHVPGHFNRGGNDKWRRYFGPAHADSLHLRQFTPLLKSLGYEAPESLQQPAASEEPSVPGFTHAVGATNAAFAFDPNWDMLPGPIPYWLRTTSADLNNHVRRVLLSEEFTGLLDAGGVGPNSPPWSPRLEMLSRVQAA